MNCIVCGVRSDRGVFCDDHVPKYGDIVHYRQDGRNYTLFVGSIPINDVLCYWLLGRRIIKWWLGTDALTMWFYPPGKSKFKVKLHRIKMRIINVIIYQHWFCGSILAQDVIKGGISLTNRSFSIIEHQAKKYDVKKKNGGKFTVGYYHPESEKGQEYIRWVYGIDIVELLPKRDYPPRDCTFLRYNGKTDIVDFLESIDVYIRPSRHDAAPARLVSLCVEHGIPFWHWGTMEKEPDYFMLSLFILSHMRSRQWPERIEQNRKLINTWQNI